MSHLRAIARRVLLEQGGEPQEPSFWREVGRTVMGPEDEPSFSREVVKTVQRAVRAAPSSLKGWVDSAPQVAAFILSPAGLRDAVMKGTIDAFLGSPANAPGAKDPVFTRSAWTLQQIHVVLQAAGSGMDAADIVDAILYFAEAVAESDDSKKEELLNNGAISMVASIPALGATLAARGVLNGAEITAAHVRQMENVLDTPEAASLLGRQGVDDAQQAVQALRTQETIAQTVDPERVRYAELIVDDAKRASSEAIRKHVSTELRLPNVKSPLELEQARLASMHAKTGDYTVPALPAESEASRALVAKGERSLEKIGMSPEQIAQTRGASGALARLGMKTLGFQFTTSSGHTATIVVGPDGVTRAFYISSGTGSGTPAGLWVPYRGQSLEFNRAGGLNGQHVVKYAVGAKVPAASAGVDREVFDAVNHPQVSGQLKAMHVVRAFDQGDTNWQTETLGNFAYKVDQIGKENAQLVRNGVEIGAGDTGKAREFLLPWPHNEPVPAYLVGRVVTPDDVMDGLRWAETDASGNRVTRSYREWHASRQSREMMKPINQAEAMTKFVFMHNQPGYKRPIMPMEDVSFMSSIGRL